MGKRSSSSSSSSLALCALFLIAHILVLVTGQSTTNASSYKTLSGKDPIVVARGGFSGTFPDSSSAAYGFALEVAPDSTLWCDVHLTSDGVPICVPSITLNNCTDIAQVYPSGQKKYDVNGMSITGWFAVDFNISELSQVGLVQAIWSRTERFDYTGYPILPVTDLASQIKPPFLWLNMQYPRFYQQHGHNLRNYTISLSKEVVINFISSPEEGFLRGISSRVSPTTKLIFRFLPEEQTDPSTNKTYASLEKNLTHIKTFASGILVPKGYVWPVTNDNYLKEATTLVTEAHKAGLEVYAADFANDNLFSWNYSYDPLAEYLQFVDKGGFSVDGFLTDYPITSASAIGCFKDLNTSNLNDVKPLVISHNGASGDYPDCTDLGYQKAVDDGADVIDCTVQVTRDGVLICMSNINLISITTVSNTQFSSRISTVPAIQSTPGIFTFNLTWNEISKSLRPVISAPQSQYYLSRNPRNKNSGNFMRLSDFLAFARGKSLAGILLILENVVFIQEKLGVDIIGGVTTAVTQAGYGNQTSQQVNVLSDDSAVLSKLRQDTKYKLLYKIDGNYRDASTASVADIKLFADAVAIDKDSVYPIDHNFITNMTNIVKRFQSAGLKVYGYGFMNEFVSQAWDFFADATVELNTYFYGAHIDGYITDFPGTARRYKSSKCFSYGNNNNTPVYFDPVQVGDLITVIVASAQPPALAPLPVLSASDVLESPLAPVSSNTPSNSSAPSTQNSHASQTVTSLLAAVLLLPIVLLLV